MRVLIICSLLVTSISPRIFNKSTVLANYIHKIPARYEINFRTCFPQRVLTAYLKLNPDHVVTIQTYKSDKCDEPMDSYLNEREALYFRHSRKFSPNLSIYTSGPSYFAKFALPHYKNRIWDPLAKSSTILCRNES